MRWVLHLSLLLICSGCDSSSRIDQLQKSFDSAYRELALPSQQAAAPVELTRWDSLLRTYRLQLEETPAVGEEAERQWRSLQHRLIVLEEQIEAYRHRPALYNLGGILQQTLSRKYVPLTQRLERIQGLLQRSPAYYRQAVHNLQQVTDSEARLCIEKQSLGIKFLEYTLQDSLQKAGWPTERKAAFRADMEEARRALNAYRRHCAHLFKYSE